MISSTIKKNTGVYSWTVGRYYDENQFLYNFASPKTKEIHHGFWYKGTKNSSEAVRNTTKAVASLLKPKKSDKVLDAGCGIGGPAIYMAENFGSHVTGITVSRKQLRMARSNSGKTASNGLLRFMLRDYMNNGFRSGSFSKIFGIESVCHAVEKPRFLKEAYRLLKPGGRLIVCDAFLIKDRLSLSDRAVYDKFLRGWLVPNLAQKKDFFKWIKQAGFRKVRYYDKKRFVLGHKSPFHSSFLSYLILYMAIVASKILSYLRIVPKSYLGTLASVIYMNEIITRGIVTYGIFLAEK